MQAIVYAHGVYCRESIDKPAMKRHLIFLTLSFLFVTTFLGWASLAGFPATGYYPHLAVAPGSEVSTEFFFSGYDDSANCEKMLAATVASAKSSCPACKLESQCSRGLSEFHRRVLGNQPIPDTSIRMKNGVLIIHAKNSTDAMALCEALKVGFKETTGSCAAPNITR